MRSFIMLLTIAILPVRAGAEEPLRLNQIQVIGTHNSYHVAPQSELMRALGGISQEWQYTNRPLDEQFGRLGIRQIELDVFADPKGGLFANPAGARSRLTRDPTVTDRPVPEAMLEKGFKVLHVQDVDFETTCLTFRECLETVKAWSDANESHVPIMILVEPKDGAIADPLDLGFVKPVAMTSKLFDSLDEEILSVFSRKRIITPDEVRGRSKTLEKAIQKRGWPLLEKCRGRVLFCLDNGGEKREMYLRGHSGLKKRVMFVDSRPGQPEAAFAKLNDPIKDQELIRELVQKGFLVRTRADANLEQGLDEDTTRRDAALSSGAQFVSTDFPELSTLIESDYCVRLPDGIAVRPNPVTAKHVKVDVVLEKLEGQE